MKTSTKRQKKFTFGSFVYHYDLLLEDRKTLSLTVTPDLRIRVKSPRKADSKRIEVFLQRKWFWLEKQLNFFRKYQRKTYKKEYLSGESFLYLGRQYKLLVKRSVRDSVVMKSGLLIAHTTKSVRNSRHTKKLLDEWYEKQIERVFNKRYQKIAPSFKYEEMPVLVIREMQKRWGSFLKSGKIILNPKLIYLPTECIDYVITHELCHVTHKNHDKIFFSFLEEKYPSWKKIKEKLELMGSSITY